MNHPNPAIQTSAPLGNLAGQVAGLHRHVNPVPFTNGGWCDGADVPYLQL